MLSEVKDPCQRKRTASPWSFREIVAIRMWHIVWVCLFRWTPKFLRIWRQSLLRLSGCRIVSGQPYIDSSVKIYAPFNLTIEHGVSIGEGCDIYNLGRIRLNARCVLSRDVLLCGGGHDLCKLNSPLIVGDIQIGREAFIGARAIIMHGVTIGEGAVVGAGAVVTKDVEPWTVVGGNPAKFIKRRVLKGE